MHIASNGIQALTYYKHLHHWGSWTTNGFQMPIVLVCWWHFMTLVSHPVTLTSTRQCACRKFTSVFQVIHFDGLLQTDSFQSQHWEVFRGFARWLWGSSWKGFWQISSLSTDCAVLHPLRDDAAGSRSQVGRPTQPRWVVESWSAGAGNFSWSFWIAKDPADVWLICEGISSSRPSMWDNSTAQRRLKNIMFFLGHLEGSLIIYIYINIHMATMWLCNSDNQQRPLRASKIGVFWSLSIHSLFGSKKTGKTV